MVSNYFYSLSPTCIYGVQSKCLISATMRVPAWAGNVATGLSLRDFPLLDAPCRMTATDDTVPDRYNITSLLCGGLTLSYVDSHKAERVGQPRIPAFHSTRGLTCRICHRSVIMRI